MQARWACTLLLDVVAGIGWPDYAVAQILPQAACQNPTASRTAIYFVNRVTTTLDEARLNGGKLELEFLKWLPMTKLSVQTMCHVFFLNINPASGAVNKFWEAGQQRFGLTPTAFWQQLEGAELATSSVIAPVLQGSIGSADQIHQEPSSATRTPIGSRLLSHPAVVGLSSHTLKAICTVMPRMTECLARFRIRRQAP